MKRILTTAIALTTVPVVMVWAGALLLQVGKADGHSEAKRMNAVLVATSTACHEPGKSVVTASYVQRNGDGVRRMPLKVAPLDAAGTFAVLGDVPAGSLIDLAVTNPEYKNYQPRVLIRTDSRGVAWGSVRRFFSTAPTEGDVRGMLALVD